MGGLCRACRSKKDDRKDFALFLQKSDSCGNLWSRKDEVKRPTPFLGKRSSWDRCWPGLLLGNSARRASRWFSRPQEAILSSATSLMCLVTLASLKGRKSASMNSSKTVQSEISHSWPWVLVLVEFDTTPRRMDKQMTDPPGSEEIPPPHRLPPCILIPNRRSRPARTLGCHRLP